MFHIVNFETQVYNNEINENNENGLYMIFSDNNRIIKNSFNDNNNSIFILYSEGNIIEKNSMGNNNNYGIYIFDNRDSRIRDNYADSNEVSDFYIENSKNITIINNTGSIYEYQNPNYTSRYFYEPEDYNHDPHYISSSEDNDTVVCLVIGFILLIMTVTIIVVFVYLNLWRQNEVGFLDH